MAEVKLAHIFFHSPKAQFLDCPAGGRLVVQSMSPLAGLLKRPSLKYSYYTQTFYKSD